MIAQPDRTLRWEGCRNVRDLGGYQTEDGGTTRFGAIVRADNLWNLTDAGWSALEEYGIETIVDLRWPEEREEDRPGRAPSNVARISLFGERGDFGAVDRVARPLRDPVERKRTAYLTFLDRFAPNFARAVTAVGASTQGGLAVQCAGGADRAGLVVALLLRLVRVPIAEVAADYEVSEGSWAPFVGTWIAEGKDEEERDHRRLLALFPAEAMVGVLVELERRHGSIHGYLRTAGVAEAALEAVRRRLLA